MKNTDNTVGYYGALTTLLLSSFMATLAVSSVNILLPELVVSLNTNYANAQWVSISYMILLSSTLVLGGRLSDIYGQRKLFIIGTIIFTLSAGLCGLSQNVWTLSAFRALQGVGAAILVAVNLAMVREISPRHKMNMAMGLMGSLSAIGTATGPIVGGFIANATDWNTTFFINIPLGFTVLLMAIRYLPNTPKFATAERKKLDYPGAMLLFLVVLGYSLFLKHSITAPMLVSTALLGLTLISLLMFIRQQNSTKYPLLNLSIVRDYRFSLSFIVNFMVSTAVMTSLVIGPFYLTVALNLNISAAGLVMAISPIFVAITSFIIGRTLIEKNTSSTVTIGLLLLTTGTTLFANLDISFGVLGYIACLAFTAIGYGTFTSSNNTQIMNLVTSNQGGQVSGLLNLSRNLGLLTGATLMSALFELNTHTSVTGTFTAKLAELGLNRVYVVATVLLCIALVLRLHQQYRGK